MKKNSNILNYFSINLIPSNALNHIIDSTRYKTGYILLRSVSVKQGGQSVITYDICYLLAFFVITRTRSFSRGLGAINPKPLSKPCYYQ